MRWKMDNFKKSILEMPVWKGFVCVFLIVFGISVTFEIILSHTVFHVFDRALEKFELDKKSDLADLDDMDKSEQQDYCDKYKLLIEEKADLAKRSPNEFSYDFAFNTMQSHEKDISFAIKQHYFNLKKCEATIKGNKA